MIKYLTTIVIIKHVNTKDTINVTTSDPFELLKEANKYHNNWRPVTRLQKWFRAY